MRCIATFSLGHYGNTLLHCIVNKIFLQSLPQNLLINWPVGGELADEDENGSWLKKPNPLEVLIVIEIIP